MNPIQSTEKNMSTYRYAGFGIRLLASFIDSVLVAIIILPFLIHTYGWEYLFPVQLLQESQGWTFFVHGPIDFLLSYVLPPIAVVIFWIWRSATPGKIILSLTIVDATTGSALTKKQCLLRYLGYYVSLIPLGLGFLVILFDKKRQGWHDKIANTVVIYKCN